MTTLLMTYGLIAGIVIVAISRLSDAIYYGYY